MKKIFVMFLILFEISLPAYAKNSSDKKIFIYHIPEEISQKVEPKKTSVEEDIVSDDVTANTSNELSNEISDEDDVEEYNECEVYELDDMYTDVLKGYAVYDEEDENSIFLDTKEDYFKVNIKQPQKLTSTTPIDFNLEESPKKVNSSKYDAPEYLITPVSNKNSKSFGGFSAGTTYSHEVSYGELEQTSGVFSKYQYKNFSISTSFSKTVNSTNNTYNDKIGFAPELKLNQYLTIKESFSTDLIKRKNKAELKLSINPLGKKDIDRINFDFGASRTYSLNDSTFKNQIQFETRFKL